MRTRWAAGLLLLVFISALWYTAQAAGQAPSDQAKPITVTGEILTVTGDVLIMPDYVVQAPAPLDWRVFRPGAQVEVSGFLQPDQITLIATSITLLSAPPEPEPTMSAEASAEPAISPEPTATLALPRKPEPRRGAECDQPPGSAALQVSKETGQSVALIRFLYCAGYGYGEITLMLVISGVSGADVHTVLIMRADGMGYGQIARALGVTIGWSRVNGRVRVVAIENPAPVAAPTPGQPGAPPPAQIAPAPQNPAPRGRGRGRGQGDDDDDGGGDDDD
jgi:hypothetical protein